MSWYNVISHDFKMYVTEITKCPHQPHYNEHLLRPLTMTILKSFVIYRQLLFHSEAL